ncbi:MAG: HPr(Ser) kinase/phosphatase [Candidatus Accumulibacter sp.]|jgi:HPr kinase/phosphorylase|nr:HPr(Ser) kinase/phosphatase [Accumulibacter sp.]
MSEASILNLARFCEDNADKLKRITQTSDDRFAALEKEEFFAADMIGYLNAIHSRRIQVIGNAEFRWIEKAGADRWRRLIEQVVAQKPPAMILADGIAPPPWVREFCETSQTPLFATSKSGSETIETLQLYLARHFADTASLHGVFMDVFGIGVLITGESGIGKSELALDLVSRGHGLVADDVVKLSRISPTIIEGRCPDMLRDYLEVRGLGLLNIRTIYGETAARRKMKLRLIVHLAHASPIGEISRLPSEMQSQEVLGVPVRKLLLHVAPGRNLAVLVEAAVRIRILQLRGIDGTEEFVARHRQAMHAALAPDI